MQLHFVGEFPATNSLSDGTTAVRFDIHHKRIVHLPDQVSEEGGCPRVRVRRCALPPLYLPKVWEVFQLLGISGFFNVKDSRDEAVRCLLDQTGYDDRYE